MTLLKCYTQYASQFGKLSSGHRTGKGVFISIPKNGNAKDCSDYCTIILISHASKVMAKILNGFNRHEFEQALGVGEGQGSLVCCSLWDHRELDMTE